MYTNFIRAISEKKKGNLLLIAVIMIILPILTISMAQLLIATEAYQVKTLNKLEDRYIEFSKSEIAVYSVINQIEGQYLDEINISNIKSSTESILTSKLNINGQASIEDNIGTSGTLKVEIISNNTKKPAFTIKSINLIEEIIEIETEEGTVEHIRYIIDCSNCMIERGIRYE